MLVSCLGIPAFWLLCTQSMLQSNPDTGGWELDLSFIWLIFSPVSWPFISSLFTYSLHGKYNPSMQGWLVAFGGPKESVIQFLEHVPCTNSFSRTSSSRDILLQHEIWWSCWVLAPEFGCSQDRKVIRYSQIGVLGSYLHLIVCPPQEGCRQLVVWKWKSYFANIFYWTNCILHLGEMLEKLSCRKCPLPGPKKKQTQAELNNTN